MNGVAPFADLCATLEAIAAGHIPLQNSTSSMGLTQGCSQSRSLNFERAAGQGMGHGAEPSLAMIRIAGGECATPRGCNRSRFVPPP